MNYFREDFKLISKKQNNNILYYTIRFYMSDEVKLKLGDIIQIRSPTNVQYNLKYFFVEFINDDRVDLIDLNTGDKNTLEINEQKFIDTTVVELILLSRSELDGFAKQNNLLPNTDVQLLLKDGVSVVGKITNLEEDMIEIKTTDDKTLYIDFGYSGNPLDNVSIVDELTIQKSLELGTREVTREFTSEEVLNKDGNKVLNKDVKTDDADVKTESSIEFSPEGNAIIHMDENPTKDDSHIHDLVTADFEDDESKPFFKESQNQEMLEKLLKTKGMTQSRAHSLVSKFKEMRKLFSTFDSNGNIVGFSRSDPTQKPLVDYLSNLENKVDWIFPVVSGIQSIETITAKTDIDVYDEDTHRFKRFVADDNVPVKNLLVLFKKPHLDKTFVKKTLDCLEYPYEKSDFKTNILFDVSCPSFKEALQAIVPSGESFLDDCHVGYSIDQMMKWFEPLKIDKDCLSSESEFYKLLRKQVDTNIKSYIEDFAHGKSSSKQETKAVHDAVPTALFNNMKSDILSRLKKEYSVDDSLSTGELLSKMNKYDHGEFYFSVMSAMMAYLYTPELANIVDKNESFSSSKSCAKRVIAKKYLSVNALQKDNGRSEVFFDKDIDTTPYDILKKHLEAQKNMPADQFLDYLTVVLKTEHGIEDAEMAETLAKTIISKKKPVEDGNYAVLIIYPKLKTIFDESTLSSSEKESVEIEADAKKRVSYFIRKNDNWVQDKTMSDAELTTEMLCSVDNKCFFDKNREFCEMVEDASARMKRIAKRNIRGEFDTTISETMKDFEEKLGKISAAKEKQISKLVKLHKYNRELYSARAYAIGAKLVEKEIVLSPYAALRDKILSHHDFGEKQEFIVQFRRAYCREAVINNILNESIHWFYCKETNVKLLPVFFYKMAVSNDYEKTVCEIISENGLVEDGGIVDKHSGYFIDEDDVRFVVEDLFVLDTTIMKTKCVKPTRGTDQYCIYVVAKGLCDNLDVDFDEIGERIISFTLCLINHCINEIKYRANKLNSQTPYHIWKSRNLVIFTAAITFVFIQTECKVFLTAKASAKASTDKKSLDKKSTDKKMTKTKTSMETKKSVAASSKTQSKTKSDLINNKETKGVLKNCLEGFPLEESENFSGLKRICEILDDMKSIFEDPWTHVKKYSADKFFKEMLVVIKKNLLVNSKIKQMIEDKRIVMNTFVLTVPPPKWPLFQPPPMPVKISVDTSVPPVLKSEIKDSIKTADKAQHKYLGILYKKIIENTYAHIQDKSENTFEFVKEYGQIYSDLKQLTVPPTLLSKTAKTVSLRESTAKFSETNMYASFVHYCNLRRAMPIPDDLSDICQEKMLGIETMTQEEAMQALEENGKKQTKDTLAQLMTIVANRNLIHIAEEEAPLSFPDIDTSDKQDLVISHIINALANKEKVEELDHYLNKLNAKMIDNIKEYLNLYARDAKKAIKTKIATFLDKSLIGYSNIETFVKNAVYEMTVVIPASTGRYDFVGDNKLVCLLFSEISKDSIIKDIQFLITQLVTVVGLPSSIANIYKYCYLSVFSQIVSESKEDKYVDFQFKELFDGDEIEIVAENKHDFYNVVGQIIYKLLERDIESQEVLCQPYISKTKRKRVSKILQIEDFDLEF